MSGQFVNLGDPECSDHVHNHNQILLLGLLLPTNVAQISILNCSCCKTRVGSDGCGKEINLGICLGFY